MDSKTNSWLGSQVTKRGDKSSTILVYNQTRYEYTPFACDLVSNWTLPFLPWEGLNKANFSTFDASYNCYLFVVKIRDKKSEYCLPKPNTIFYKRVFDSASPMPLTTEYSKFRPGSPPSAIFKDALPQQDCR